MNKIFTILKAFYLFLKTELILSKKSKHYKLSLFKSDTSVKLNSDGRIIHSKTFVVYKKQNPQPSAFMKVTVKLDGDNASWIYSEQVSHNSNFSHTKVFDNYPSFYAIIDQDFVDIAHFGSKGITVNSLKNIHNF